MLAVPNVSSADSGVIAAVTGELAPAGGKVELLDVHSDGDHGRSVLTAAGPAPELAAGLARAASAAAERIDLRASAGVHPHVGALDVAPLVFRSSGERGAACAAALLAGDLVARRGIPVLLYGVLAGGRTRADLRRGGLRELGHRLERGEVTTDFGPARAHPRAGVTLVGARPPLVAFNLLLARGVPLERARAIAARVREGGTDGLPGVRALGLALPRQDAVQLSFNVEDHRAVPLARLVEAVRAHVDVVSAELVGLSPRAAWDGFPADLPVPGFDPSRHVLEERLGVA